MNGVKQGVTVVLMFALLFLVAFAPLLYIAHHTGYLPEGIVVSPIPPQTIPLTDRNETVQRLWEDLEITVTDTVIKVSVSGYTDSDSAGAIGRTETELLKNVEEQLTKMGEYRLLPVLSFSDAVQVSLSKDTRINASYFNSGAQAESESIAVWLLTAEYQDFRLNAYMDAETSELFGIMVFTKPGSYFNWWEYQNNNSGIPDGQEK